MIESHAVENERARESEIIATPIGSIALSVRGGLLARLSFRDGGDGTASVATSAIGRLVMRYFAGDLDAIDAIPIDDRAGTALEREVWRALRRIPCGTTISYAELAQSIGRPKAARAVGGANARNPIALVVPCHRVIGSDGKLRGYAYGLARKKWLLDFERRV